MMWFSMILVLEKFGIVWYRMERHCMVLYTREQHTDPFPPIAFPGKWFFYTADNSNQWSLRTVKQHNLVQNMAVQRNMLCRNTTVLNRHLLMPYSNALCVKGS